jgi:hypothetical protein
VPFCCEPSAYELINVVDEDFPMSQKQTPIIVSPRRPANGSCAQILSAPSAGLNALEKNSVRALVAYAALNTGSPEEEIQQRLSEKFAGANIDHLPSRSYEDVIKFLVDLCEEDGKPMEGAAR